MIIDNTYTFNSCSLNYFSNRDLIDVSCFGDSALEFVEGLYNGKLRQNSFFDGDQYAIDEQMWDEIGAAAAALVGLYVGNSAAAGVAGYEMEAKPASEPRTSEVAGAVLRCARVGYLCAPRRGRPAATLRWTVRRALGRVVVR